MNNQIETYVYESPDGGDTIYRRRSGGTQKELHSISDRKKDFHAGLRHSKLWGQIHRAAKKDPVLQEMLDQIEIYYHLKNSP